MKGTLFLFFQRTLAIFFLGVGLYVLPYQAYAQSYSRAEVKSVQENLVDYGAGKADGKFGRNTAKAIRQYQADWDIPVTGKISDELIQRLEKTHRDTKPRWQKYQNKNDCKTWIPQPAAQETVTWSGNCSNGKATGKGKRVWRFVRKGKQRQSAYEGNLRDGKAYGQSVFTWASGSRYEGEFRDGGFNGQGVYTWTNGNRYEGEFRDDDFNGQGVFTWANGNRYEGKYRDGKPHGWGKIYYASSGKAYSGIWRRGCLSTNGHKSIIDTTRKACGF